DFTSAPNLVIRAFDGTAVGESVLGRPALEHQTMDVVIPDSPPPPGDFFVEGHVRSGEFPVVGVLVQAVDLNVGSRTVLGTKTTDANGFFRIDYRLTPNPSCPKQHADLLIRVFPRGAGNVETDLLVPPLFRPDADPHLTVEIEIPGLVLGPSEYELVTGKLSPLLCGIAAADLSDADVALLALKTQLDPLHITYFVIAANSSRRTGIRPEAFYGLFRMNMPTELGALLAQTPQARSTGLQRAIEENVVPRSLQAQLNTILNQLLGLVVDHALRPGTDGTATLGSVMNLVFTDPVKQRNFLNNYLQRTGSINTFWTDLRSNPTFRNDVDNLQFTLQVATLTQNHVPLIQELQRMRTAGEVDSLRDLVRFTASDWLLRINKRVGSQNIGVPPGIPGSDDAEKARNYAATMVRIVQDSFPTAVIADRLAGDSWPRNKAGLTTFFQNNAGFDFASTSVRAYLAQNGNAFRGISPNAVTGLLNEMAGMERIFSIAPRHEEFSVLLSNGFTSARSIAQMSQNLFVGTYSGALGGEANAAEIHNRAARVSAMALTVLGSVGNLNTETGLTVLPGGRTSSGVPDVASLFGSADLCECRACNSVFGPAAYFVDLLEFLGNRPARTAGKTAKDVLLDRRPDLADIELTCENTNTVLPYVDLTNEILENALARPIVEARPGLTRTDIAGIKSKLDARIIDPALKTELSNRGYSLRDSSVASVQQPGSKWQLTDADYRFTLSADSDPARLNISASAQTSGKAEDLAANPEHVNPAAYDKLKYAVYPWNLPLNPWVEEVRVYLDHLGIRRSELMETFFKGNPKDALKDDVILRESLELTTAEAGIITRSIVSGPVTGSEPRGGWTFWGLKESGNSISNPSGSALAPLTGVWTDLLKRVDVFLQRSGLSLSELEDFLELRFINPDSNPASVLNVVSSDANDRNTCDLSKLIIANLNEPELARIHRFIRLWQKLGWTMRDLDRAITALAHGAIDWTDFLRQISLIERLRKRFNLPVVTLLTWFAPIDTGEYGINQKPRPRSLYQDLFQNPSIRDRHSAQADAFDLDAVSHDVKANLTLVITASDSDLDADRKKTVLAALRAALGVRDGDLSLLINGSPSLGVLGVVTLDKRLSVRNLTSLYRTVTMARALRLSIQDFLVLKALVGREPFADNGGNSNDTLTTLEFVKTADRIRSSGFTIQELDSLLRPQTLASSVIDPREQTIAASLDEIRRGLQKVFSETQAEPDPTGIAVSRSLSALKWNKGLIDEVTATLSNVIQYEAGVAALPASLSFPRDLPGDDLKAKVSFDNRIPGRAVLRFVGIMTAAEKAKLLNLSADLLDAPAYNAAVSNLFAIPRDFIARSLKAFELPTLSKPLAALPLPTVVFPAELRESIFYDSTQTVLRFVGPMTQREKTVLLSLTDNQPDKQPYKDAIGGLFGAYDTLALDEKNRFLTAAEAGQLTDLPTPAERFDFILPKLMAHQRKSQSGNFVQQKLAETFKLEAATANLLLNTLVPSATHPTLGLINDFIDGSFVSTDLQVKLTKEAFPIQFMAFVRLHRLATFISRFGISVEQVTWLLVYAEDAGWLNPVLLRLPTDVRPPGPPQVVVPLEKFERLIDLFQLRDALREGVELLSDIFSAARASVPPSSDALLTRLSEGTGWKIEDLKVLAGPGGFNFSLPAAFKDERALTRLLHCFAAIKRLGVSAEQCLAWTKVDLPESDSRKNTAADLTIADARSAKDAVRAKYGVKEWLEAARPLRDPLRDKQRAALAGFLVAHPEAVRQPAFSTKPQGWKDANDLYDYFLIDVEMSPCQMTSRLKQAIGSVQSFAQRCLMNLEPDVAASADLDRKWIEWKWRKNYRVWEANRKVFLYPENWIEPELRDDKSPFFVELESDLMQSELTSDAAETAVLRYLEKLDQVARLEICAMYHEIETGQPDGGDVDILHVFARTHSTLPVYFYRQRIDQAYWTPWQRVDVDIKGDHLLAVVWNRRLHLFWPIFTKETEKPQIKLPSATVPLPDPLEWWKVQMAWSEYKSGKWSGKQITTQAISTPLMIPSLNLDLKAMFFEMSIADGDLVISLKSYPSEFPTAAPLPEGPSRTPVQSGEATIALFVRVIGDYASFRFTGCGSPIQVLTDSRSNRSPFTLQGTNTEFMTFVAKPVAFAAPKGFTGRPPGIPLILAGEPSYSIANPAVFNFTPTNDPLFDFNLNTPSLNCSQVLDTTRGIFRVQTQEFQFFDERKPFFYADAYRTYFVASEIVPPPVRIWTGLDQVDLSQLDAVRNNYYPQVNIAFTTPVAFISAAPRAESLPPSAPTATTGIIGAGAQSSAIAPGGNVGLGPMGGGSNSGLNDGPQLVPTPHCERRYRFQTFYHPLVCFFVRELNRRGIDGLLQRSIQVPASELSSPSPSSPSPTTNFDFAQTYLPGNANPIVARRFPVEDVDFEFEGAYSSYNWELFFHLPLLIADRLSKNQRFEEAQKWFHYIFDPTDTSGEPAPQRYWRTRPFFLTSAQTYKDQQVQNLLDRLASGTSDPTLERLVDQWSKNPFNPHLVGRLRTTAYQRTVVMKYIDNLIAWGDQLFRRDTIESINEATQLYILAARILGRRPASVPPRARPTVQTFNTLPDLGEFSNPLVKAENLATRLSQSSAVVSGDNPDVALPNMLYFCAPPNDKLLGYWDTVADRLFKIRHCLNIEGVTRQLPLFEPPIDPALLVKAAAAGIDLSSALNDVNAALPHYRLNVMAQKASELCSEVKMLGGALLAALEKRDGEALALLRSGHEIKVLDAVRRVKERQVEEAQQSFDSLQKSLEMARIRHDYYKNLERFSQQEKNQIADLLRTRSHHEDQGFWDNVANFIYALPDIKIGAPTSFGATFGGHNLGNAARALGAYHGSLAVISNVTASMTAAEAAFERRNADWDHQVEVTAKEIEQIQKQIAAAEIRFDIAVKDLENHDLQIESARSVDEFMRDKFTNRELYDWMAGQISGIYFQSYQLAYDVAKGSERAFRFELGLDDSNLIQFGYWDSLKKGLLAGERLSHDLKRMEIAYLDQNKREYELTKHISIALLDPVALIKLKETG
ncbi:MAG TPA: neuraminidase-like domain-containing protein, partial [Blastocatellia bacterium]|nr:neuraminidase-like domain-containing protein [Blastocatellia bacterium]